VKLSTTYRIRGGDTFETIARRVYGTEQEALRVAQANPGVEEPLSPGVAITVTTLPSTPVNLPQQTEAENINEVAVLIDDERFRFWDSLRITRAVDALDVVEFGAPFDPELESFRNTFRPFEYKDIGVSVGGVPLFTGTAVSVNPILENLRSVVSVSGYSLPGVMADCTAPASAFPLEFEGQGLLEIAKTVAGYFGIGVEFTADQGDVFTDPVALEPGGKALQFLIGLAQQRGLVISSTPGGALLFQKSVESGNPTVNLEQGRSPLLSVTPFFSPEDYYSSITGITPVVIGSQGSQFTVKNDSLSGVLRPFTFKAPDTTESSAPTAVHAKLGRMFANMASYSVRLNTWRDPSGSLWTPNTTINLLAPDAMIYSNYEFILRSVEFNKDRVTETATLDLVMPGAFSGREPETVPWGE